MAERTKTRSDTKTIKIKENRFVTILTLLLYFLVFLVLLSVNKVIFEKNILLQLSVTFVSVVGYYILFEASLVRKKWTIEIPSDIVESLSKRDKLYVILRILPFSVLVRVFLAALLELFIVLVLAGASFLNAELVWNALQYLGALSVITGIMSVALTFLGRSSVRSRQVLEAYAVDIINRLLEILSFREFASFLDNYNGRDLRCIKRVRIISNKIKRYVLAYDEIPILRQKELQEMFKNRINKNPVSVLRDMAANLVEINKGFNGYYWLEQIIKDEALNEKEYEELINCLNKAYEAFIESKQDKIEREKKSVQIEIEALGLEYHAKKIVTESMILVPPFSETEEMAIFLGTLEAFSFQKLIFYRHFKKVLDYIFPEKLKIVLPELKEGTVTTDEKPSQQEQIPQSSSDLQ